jgi:hypothetical protein
MARTPPTKCDRLIGRLTQEQRSTLEQLIAEHAPATELHRYLSAIGPVTYDSVLTWYNREYPPGEKALSANRLVGQCRGLSHADAHAAALAAVVTVSARLIESFEALNIESAWRSAGTLVDVLREQRQCAQALAQAQRLGDRRALELAGGYRVAELALTIARDTVQDSAVQEVIQGALARFEEECK